MAGTRGDMSARLVLGAPHGSRPGLAGLVVRLVALRAPGMGADGWTARHRPRILRRVPVHRVLDVPDARLLAPADLDVRLEALLASVRDLPLAPDRVASLVHEIEACRALAGAVVGRHRAPCGDEAPANDAGDPRIARVLAALRRRLGAAWTVAALARIAGMSRAAFARLFTEMLGVPPLRHLASLRMREAARLLVETDAGLAAIAGQLGYASEFALSRAFKRHLGVAPARYRRRHRDRLRGPSTSPAHRPVVRGAA
jgi:AraC-like DNA-binding protein